ncbi:hypothetical protein GK047_04315 [Paenibacillus sp. SYP-B3998]|uniref:Uncharacterized protein n=1 Tax=Paenibacillus sp. SYP-B3998 TaxID=2678564 RepID=A0A6G3ZU60_9BACL|nr:hypothetical protein [Paenibacillus sp. SYP-B3998]NEW05244.1 hypothetical protein [Paenibacillus sp. SYP-B3998]
MIRYWLTPIVNKSPLKFGKARVNCEPLLELESLRNLSHQLHPRLLPMFKASLLLSDDEDVCGSTYTELNLSDANEVVFDGHPYHLSHCAEAFLERVLRPAEALGFVSSMDLNVLEGVSGQSKYWRRLWIEWLESGWEVILLREDGG